MTITYKDSGVDKEEGYRLVDNVKNLAKETHSPNVLSDIGSFAALYELKNYKEPILVSGTDGVGTKLEVAFKANRYDTVGIDCVAMCVNDILCHGAKPLFFLDYIACGQLDAEHATDLVKGIAEGCKQANCSLVGGETAEMPGFYKKGDYDIAGFSLGVCEKSNIIDSSKIKEGDYIIGLPSSGVHSNGFSLIRKLFNDFSIKPELLNGKTLEETLLTPTKIYVKPILSLLEQVHVKGMAHITGGGIIENIPRIIPDGLCAKIDKNSIPVSNIFKLIESYGVQFDEMLATFNMGIGFTIVVEEKELNQAVNTLEGLGEKPFILGSIITSNQAKKIWIA